MNTKSGEVGRRGEVGGREVGRREKLWGREKGEKNQKLWVGEDVFLVHPKNIFNGLILNWCIGGCMFTPTIFLSSWMWVLLFCSLYSPFLSVLVYL
jgi:hypothetical protein